MCERDLAVLADQIRAVRAAEKRFMTLWQVEGDVVAPEVLDRLAADLDEIASLAEEFCDLQREVDQQRNSGRDADDRGRDADRNRAGAFGGGGLGYRHSPRWPMNEADGSAGGLN